MSNPIVSNPNDFKVVSFHNSTSFDFVPEMGCMYDGRAINGRSGAPGIQAGETLTLPYHIGHRLAINLAKRVLNTSQAATVDKAGIPTGEPIWSETRLNELALTYVKDLYTEEKPVAQSETDKLMAKVEEYKAMVDKLMAGAAQPVIPVIAPVITDPTVPPIEPLKVEPKAYLDKKEVIDELTKRGIKFEARKNKAELEKLLI